MYKKKLLTLVFASLLPLGHTLYAEEVQGMASEAADTAEAPATEAVAPTMAEDRTGDHWHAREAQYQALRRRAEEVGVMLPERPPWRSVDNMQPMRPGMKGHMQQRKMMMSMSDEERDAYRRERYREMREQAQGMGVDMPETPPWVVRQQALDEEWAKHQEVIKGMSNEERTACHAMHRRHLGMMPGRGMGHRDGCGMMGQGGCGMMGPAAAPGMGYGPYGYGPSPYAPGNFWDPNQ